MFVLNAGTFFGTFLRTSLVLVARATLGAMAKKRIISDTRTHKLTVSGGKSYVVVLPVEFVRHLGWRERQKLDITLDGETIVIKDWKK